MRSCRKITPRLRNIVKNLRIKRKFNQQLETGDVFVYTKVKMLRELISTFVNRCLIAWLGFKETEKLAMSTKEAEVFAFIAAKSVE